MSNPLKRPATFDIAAEAARETREEDADMQLAEIEKIGSKTLLATVVPSMSLKAGQMAWEVLSNRFDSTRQPKVWAQICDTFFAWWDALPQEVRAANRRRMGDFFCFAMAEVHKARQSQ